MQRRNEGNAKCKNSRLEPPFGDLGATHRVYLYGSMECVVDFLLVLIELFSLALTAGALLSESVEIGVF